MVRIASLLLVGIVSLSLVACGSEPGAGTGEAAPWAAAISDSESAACREPAGRFEVMTRNLYLGADVMAVVVAPADSVVEAATEFWAKVQATDFPARARVLAREIARARPEVLGLQEVTTYRTGDPLVCLGEARPSQPVASDVALDFLAILQDELARRGVDYRVVGRVTSTDVELCILDTTRPGELLDLRYTDQDLLLVRGDVHWRDPTLPSVTLSDTPGDQNGARYSPTWTACFDLGGDTVCSWRGWTAAEVKVGHAWVRVLETHLEDWLPIEGYPDWLFQAGQAAELISILDGSMALAPLPAVVLGDFNAYVTGHGRPPVYRFLVGGPFPLDPSLHLRSPLDDAWVALHGHEPGFTWGFDELLRSGTLSTRLDLVLVSPGLRPEFSYLVGVEDRTPGALHPSDHAGIVTGLVVR
jgi:endonuclease/exonuclease/phosphatase family metal-dependent hydrolase